MYFLQILNSDSLRKTIVDSINQAQNQQFKSLDYINKIDAFYNSAWTKLTVLFALVGVLLPLVISFIQTRRNEKDQKNIKEDILKDIKSEVNLYLDEKLNKIQHASEGVSYQIQSDILFERGKYKDSFGETVNAMTCYFIGDDYNNFLNAMEDLQTRMKHVNKADIEKVKEEYGEYYDVNSLVQKLENCDDVKYSCHFTKIKLAVSSII